MQIFHAEITKLLTSKLTHSFLLIPTKAAKSLKAFSSYIVAFASEIREMKSVLSEKENISS